VPSTRQKVSSHLPCAHVGSSVAPHSSVEPTAKTKPL